MTHLSDEQLTLLYYGEEAADGHFEGCAECRERYEALRRTLGAVEFPTPELAPDYGSEVWSKIEPRIEARRPTRILRWVLPIAAALILVLGGSFEAGRIYQAKRQPPPIPDRETAERILLVAVGDYLERSQIVLIELANADPNAPLDISQDQERVRDLVAENRLYRQTAARTGQAGIANLLEDLDRVLLEIEHAPSTMPPESVKQLRRQLKDDGMLFKMRIMGENVEKL